MRSLRGSARALPLQVTKPSLEELTRGLGSLVLVKNRVPNAFVNSAYVD